jgi:predicted metal-dependent RNase
VRASEAETEGFARGVIPAEAEITNVLFDPIVGEVIIEAKKPGLAIGKDGVILQEIIKATRWRPRVLRTPPIPSKIIAHTRHYLHSEVKERERILRSVGERIFRPAIFKNGDIRVTALGGFQQVGRSALLLQTRDGAVLLDCGINPGSTNPSDTFPRLDVSEFDLGQLDAVIISHAHLDHCLHPNTYIQLSSGEIARICDVQTGERVPAADFYDTMQLEDMGCIQRGRISAPKVMLEVRTKTKRIKVTPEHPFFTLNGKDIKVKPAKALERGDYLATLKSIEFKGKRQRVPRETTFPLFTDIETCQILGYILGNGGKMGDNYNTVCCTDKNMENLHHYAKLINRKFDLTVKVVKGERHRLMVHSIKFRRWLEEIEPTLLVKSPLRKIPRVICRVSNDELAAFLKGLFDAEGCVREHSIVLSTSSENIAQITQLLLLRFGIISHLYDHDEKSSTFGGGKAYYLVIYDPDSIKTFTSKIGFDDERKRKKLLKMLPKIGYAMAPKMDLLPVRGETIISIARKLGLKKNDLRKLGFHYYHYRTRHYPSRKKIGEVVEKLIKIAGKTGNQQALLSLSWLRKIVESNIMWEPVTEVRQMKADCTHVYDLTVLGHSNYIANGLIVHNCGFLPFLYKYGYDGPVYSSEPTVSLMALLQLDYLDVSSKEGVMPPYDQKDVREAVIHSIPLKMGVVTDISPDIRITLHNAGHILGSSVVHVHIGEGLQNIVYTGDYKFGRTMLFEPAATNFPRVETLITESTYGGSGNIMPHRMDVEGRLVSIVNETVKNGGKVLIPVLAVGRAQEIMLILDNYMRQGVLAEVPIYNEGMISEVTAIHTAYPEYLSKELRDKILYHDINPFQSEYFVTVKNPDERPAIISGGPCVILATSGMLEGGPVLEYFRELASDERNTLVFVSYQIDGTLGSRVQHGVSEVTLMNRNGRMEVIKVKMRTASIEGLSGHSDRNQILGYVRRVSPKPEHIIVCHGEKAKCIGMASLFRRMFRVESCAPENLETIRLR